MANASPPNDITLELTFSQYMGMKAASTAIGSVIIGTNAERRWNRKAMHHETDDDGFQDQIPLQSLDGFIDQP